MTPGKTIALITRTLVSKVMSPLFNMLSRFVIAFLPRNKCLLISWLQSQNKVCHCFHCFPIYLPRSDGTGCHDLSFLNVEFKPTFSPSSFTSLCHKGGVICLSEVIDIFPSNLDSSLCFIQPSNSHDVLCIEVK